MKTAILIMVILASCSGGKTLVGHWRGDFDNGRNILNILVKITKDSDGKYNVVYDIPSINQYDVDVSNIEHKENVLSFVTNFNGKYSGKLSKDGKNLIGVIALNGMELPFEAAIVNN